MDEQSMIPIEEERAALEPAQAVIMREMIVQVMSPVMEAMGKLLEQNTAALQQLSAAQQVQNDRLEALERQLRLNTPVTRQQARYMSAAVKERTAELLEKAGAAEDAKAMRRLSGIIKKDVLAGYGVTGFEEIPRHEYTVCLNTIKTWNNMRAVREVAREARTRLEAQAEP